MCLEYRILAGERRGGQMMAVIKVQQFRLCILLKKKVICTITTTVISPIGFT